MPSGRLRFLAGLLSLLLQAAAAPVSSQAQGNAVKPSELVNALRGSDSSSSYSRGNTFPAVAVPFGFNLWTPVTQPNPAGQLYAYADKTIQGFAVSHEPSPWLGDNATFQVMPSVGKLDWRDTERAQSFSHARELAKAHYYRVQLDSGIRVEITPTLHAAALRITFPARGPRNLLFDAPDKASGEMSADPAQGEVSGRVSSRGPKLYFFAKVDAPVQSVQQPPDAGPSVAISFNPKAPRTVTLRVGTSFLSVEQARTHVEQELSDLSFDALQAQAEARWDSYLNRIQIEGASDSQMVTFYSNLYRALLYPNTLTEEVDGAPKHFSPYSYEVRPGEMYVNNGFGATYRAAWPLYTLLAPRQTGRMLDGFVNAYREGGWVPRYRDGMLGSQSDVVFADAYQKGVRNFDVNAAYSSMLKDALVIPNRAGVGRSGMARGMFRNYIPHEDTAASAAWHLENSVDDFSISQLAHALGDETHAQYLRLRSLRYAALFSPTLGFFRGRLADGHYRTTDEAFRPEEWGYEFGEGCAWHYVAAANHDPGGMISLHGGPKAFTAKLDALLSAAPGFGLGSYKQPIPQMLEARDGGMGQYAHSSEATHHILYMYDYAGQPWQTQRHVREVLSEAAPFYGSGAAGGGYLGDEDTGQMAAWYVFSALGFYPASPGHASYAIGSPLFKRATLNLENGKTFEVQAHDNAANHVYIQRALLNGRAHDAPYLTHAEIVNGGRLELFMGESASTWGSAALAQPEHADTKHLAEGVLLDCAQGGAASASSENHEAGEEANAAFDDDSRTKWLATTPSAWLRYQSASPCAARFYTLTSANDEPARDPKEWVVEGSNDGESWSVLDERRNQHFAFRHQTRVFQLPQPAGYRSYRLQITANYGEPVTQLAEVEFLSVRGQDAPVASQEPPAGESSWFYRLATRCGCSVVAPGVATAPGPLVLLGTLLLLLSHARRRLATCRAASKPARNRAGRRPAARGGRARAPAP